jgi:hypothetical protein
MASAMESSVGLREREEERDRMGCPKYEPCDSRSEVRYARCSACRIWEAVRGFDGLDDDEDGLVEEDDDFDGDGLDDDD